MSSIKVVAGQKRDVVGEIVPAAGMLTSEGRVQRVTEKSLVFEGGARRRNLDGITVRHSEAVRFGYPYAEGSTRYLAVTIRRDGELLSR